MSDDGIVGAHPPNNPASPTRLANSPIEDDGLITNLTQHPSYTSENERNIQSLHQDQYSDHDPDYSFDDQPLMNAIEKNGVVVHTRLVPNYTLHRGKNRFCCGGRCVTGPWSDSGANSCVWFSLTVPTALFYAFAAPELATKSIPLLSLCVVAGIWTIILLILTQCTDPGIIPRGKINVIRPEEYAVNIRQQNRNANSDLSRDDQQRDGRPKSPNKPPPRLEQNADVSMTQPLASPPEPNEIIGSNHPSPLQSSTSSEENRDSTSRSNGIIQLPYQITRRVDGHALTFRWCTTCQIYRPPRASHCQDCDNCVKEFDHHCPFVGNCVAQRNYGFFVMFLISVMVYMAVVIFGVITATAKDIQELDKTTKIAVITALVVFFVGMTLAVGFLCGFHAVLFCTGKTTKETLGKAAKTTNHSAGNDSDSDDGQSNIDLLNSPPDIFSQFINTDLVRGGDGNVITHRTYLFNRPPSLLEPMKLVPEE